MEQEVVSEQRRGVQKLDPMARMIEMIKDLQQEIHLLKEGRTQEIKDNAPPFGQPRESPTKGRVSSKRGS